MTFRGTNYDPSGGRHIERRAYTPNNPGRPTQFQYPNQGGPVVHGPTHAPAKIEIARAKPGSINIQTTAPGNSPKIERRAGPINLTFNPAPVQNGGAPPPPQLQIQKPAPAQITPGPAVQTKPFITGSPVANRPTSPVIRVNGPVTIQTQPVPLPVQITATPVQPTQIQRAPVQPVQPVQSDQFCRLSLLSFVSSFEDGKSFNETDLATLGLDLKCQEPLLPMLHSVLSDAPLLDKSVLAAPECYTKIAAVGNPQEKLPMFSDETLLFIFYSFARDPLQMMAADELIKHGYCFDEEAEVWKSPNGMIWSVDQWKEVPDPSQADGQDE